MVKKYIVIGQQRAPTFTLFSKNGIDSPGKLCFSVALKLFECKTYK
jgi:hypothetical protein